MHLKPENKWFVVFIQIRQQLPVSASSRQLDSTLTRWTYTHYFQFLRAKDVKNIIVKCT